MTFRGTRGDPDAQNSWGKTPEESKAVQPGIPGPPKFFSKGQKAEWVDICKKLRAAGYLGSTHVSLIETIVLLHGAVEKLVKKKNCDPVALVKVSVELRRALSEAGLSPSGQASVNRRQRGKPLPDPDDPMEYGMSDDL